MFQGLIRTFAGCYKGALQPVPPWTFFGTQVPPLLATLIAVMVEVCRALSTLWIVFRIFFLKIIYLKTFKIF